MAKSTKPEILRQKRADSSHKKVSLPLKRLSSKTLSGPPGTNGGYDVILSGLVDLLESARRFSARAVNTIMTTTYWEVGRRIVEHEQHGKKRAGYGEALLERLSADLTMRFGRGFSRQNLHKYRQFFLSYPAENIRSTPSGRLPSEKRPTLSGELVAIAEQASPDVFQTLSEKSGQDSPISHLRRLGSPSSTTA